MSAFEEQQLKKLADALATLTPRPAHLDRDGLLFEAGRRSVRTARCWPWATLAASTVACVLAVALLVRPEPAVVVRWVEAPPHPSQAPQPQVEPAPPAVAVDLDDAAMPPGSYWRLQQQALRLGVDQLPTTDPDVANMAPRPRNPIPSAGGGLPATLLLTGDQ